MEVICQVPTRCVVNAPSMTSQIDVDCRHYSDRELGSARLVDINDHQESHHLPDRSPDHRNSPMTETSKSHEQS